MIAQTSLMAYKEIFYHLSPREKAVLEVLRQYGVIDNLGIADALGLPINSVTGRTNSLAHAQTKLGREVRPALIQATDGKRCNRFGNQATFWEIKDV